MYDLNALLVLELQSRCLLNALQDLLKKARFRREFCPDILNFRHRQDYYFGRNCSIVVGGQES